MTIWLIDWVKSPGACKFLRGDLLSFWVRPTTADVGIRAFGKNRNDLLREITLGMQSILLEDRQDTNSLIRKSATWRVKHDGDLDILVVKWLDEILYRSEVHNEFLVDCLPIIKDGRIESQVSYVDKNQVGLELEIKAVTTHEFSFREVTTGEVVNSDYVDIPLFYGPGWVGDVVFDI